MNEKEMKKINMSLVKKSDTRLETQNKNSIDKANTSAIVSHESHCLFKLVCYP